ncbi:unnamed protein product, partial [Didymodactylos carnosus]
MHNLLLRDTAPTTDDIKMNYIPNKSSLTTGLR